MTKTRSRILPIALATVAGVGCLFVNDHFSLFKPGSLVTEASARIGRPLTPMSYAGVARRTTRRAAYGGVYGAAVVAPACAQVVNVYGQITTVCR
jgi:hypothetical protein